MPFLASASLRKRKRKAMKRIKQKYKISKKGIKKKSCHLVSKVVIDLPFEGRMVDEAGNTEDRRVHTNNSNSSWNNNKKIGKIH